MIKKRIEKRWKSLEAHENFKCHNFVKVNFKKKENFRPFLISPLKLSLCPFPPPSHRRSSLPSFVYPSIYPAIFPYLPSWFLTKPPNPPYISFSHFSTDPQITTVNLCLQQNKCFIFIFSCFSRLCVFIRCLISFLLLIFCLQKKNENLVKLVHSGIITSNSLVCSLYASIYQDVHLTSSSTFFVKTKIDWIKKNKIKMFFFLFLFFFNFFFFISFFFLYRTLSSIQRCCFGIM